VSLIDRHVASTVLRHFAYALAGLLAVFAVVTLTEELRSAGQPGWGVGQVLGFVLLTLPREAYDLFPAAALLGAVLAFGRMTNDNEIVALYAAGVPRRRLVAIALATTAALAVVGATLDETIAGPLAQRAHVRRALALSAGRALSTSSGLWLRDGTRFVNVGALRPDGSLREVYLFDFDAGHRLERFVHAGGATPAAGAWRLDEIRASIVAGDGSEDREVVAMPWTTAIDPRQMRLLWLEPDDLSLAELRRVITLQRERGQNPLGHEVALWRRASAPLYMGIMVLLGVPMVMGSGRTIRLAERATLGALVGIGFQMFQGMFTNVGLVAGFPPLLTALAPALVAIAAFSALFHRQRIA
jgi:lipopolysaccharide export system permease protein